MFKGLYLFVITLLLSGTGWAQEAQPKKNLQKLLLKDGYKAVTLSKYLTGHLYTDEVVINGVKGRFILDTGAGGTVVEEGRKDKFGLKTTESVEQGVGAGGSGLKLGISSDNKMSIGSYEIPKITLRTMDLDHVNAAMRQLGFPEVDGVIGADVLYEGNTIIDYVGMTVYFK